jgi:hypothetical protein
MGAVANRTMRIPGLGACLTLTQAARMLGVTRQAIHDAIRRGRLRAEVRELVPGGVKLTWISVASLRAYERSRRTKS